MSTAKVYSCILSLVCLKLVPDHYHDHYHWGSTPGSRLQQASGTSSRGLPSSCRDWLPVCQDPPAASRTAEYRAQAKTG